MLTPPKTIFSLLATGLLSWTLTCQEAGAVPITGSVGFAGSATATTGNSTTIYFGNAEKALGGTLDYSNVAFGTNVTFNNIVYTGTGYDATLSNVVNPLWTFKTLGVTYEFELTSLSFADIYAGWGLNTEILSGMGVARMTGKEDTVGTFTLKGAGSGSGKSFNFSFLSGSAANGNAVPDGGSTAALLGLVFVGVEVLRRKRRLS